MREISLRVNGESVSVEVEPREHLADILRDRLGLTGTHKACEQGACGACTVHLDGTPVLSCLMFAVQADNRTVSTVEGVGTAEELAPIQRAMSERHGLQCGFCTPGMIMQALDVIGRANGGLTPERVRHEMSGNLCRCTGYVSIVDAVLDAAAESGSPAAVPDDQPTQAEVQ
ncbi:(2Fe-2S)-binding protein [Pseudonocardia hispaniensis]|uniref:(2Fe-2S)-binding protein n=1 Tax=Pseudonocardia hispaniensis TaxID=904933 RepID=A0ABW1J3I6_9PSEU